MSSDTEGVVGYSMMKRARQSVDGDIDRLSDLPDCLLLHILTFLNLKFAIQTCVLSTRWKDLWKSLSILTLHSSDCSTVKIFRKFVLGVLSLRDCSVALHTLDFKRFGCVEPLLLKRLLNHAMSNNVQQLRVHVCCDFDRLPPSIFSCEILTSLKLLVYKRRRPVYSCFPTSLNLTALTTLHIANFAFVVNENNLVEPFSSCDKLKTLVIENCVINGDSQVLCISNAMLANLTIDTCLHHEEDYYTIELSTPNLCCFAFWGVPAEKLSTGNLSFLKEVEINVDDKECSVDSAFVLISWLHLLANVTTLKVSASTLQVLSFIPYLLSCDTEPPCLGNLKSFTVNVKPLFPLRRKAAKLSEEELQALPVAYEAVSYLLRNSPFAEVKIIDSDSQATEFFF